MRLWEMRSGEAGVIVESPAALRGLLLVPGTELRLVLRRAALVVIDAGGARFALSAAAAQRVIVRPIPS